MDVRDISVLNKNFSVIKEGNTRIALGELSGFPAVVDLKQLKKGFYSISFLLERKLSVEETSHARQFFQEVGIFNEIVPAKKKVSKEREISHLDTDSNGFCIIINKGDLTEINKRFDQLEVLLKEFAKEIGLVNEYTCMFCNNYGCDTIVKDANLAKVAHRQCLEEYVSEKQSKSKIAGYTWGILGSVFAAFLLFVIAYASTFISEGMLMVGFPLFISMILFKGYRYFNGPIDGKLHVVINIVMTLAMYFFLLLYVPYLYISKNTIDYGFLYTARIILYQFIHHPDLKFVLLRDLVIVGAGIAINWRNLNSKEELITLEKSVSRNSLI